MELKHICIGKTRELDIRGQKVRTAFIKEAASAPVQVNEQGLEGNDVAVHTDAVYAIAPEHYDYWAEQLDADVNDWSPGFFAENLSIAGLDESRFQVGDILSVGQEVRLRVSGPRVPCFKLCWRMGQPESFIREFALSGKSGVYFNVERPGKIQAGDEVIITSKASDSVAINHIVEYIFGRTIDEAMLQHILALPGLSETSALLLRNKLFQIQDQERTFSNRWQGWREFKVDEIIRETDEIKSFILTSQDEQPLAPYRAGQFLTVQLPDNTESPLIRVWSLSDYENKPDHYRLSIKKEPQGTGSVFMHERINPGSSLLIKPPLGRFVLDRSGFKPILLIAGGIGITPLLAMLKAHITRGETRPPLYFIHCCRNRAAQPFRSELDQIAIAHDIPMLHVYDQPTAVDRKESDYQAEGFLNMAHINALTEGCHIIHGGKRINMPLVEFDIYMCGPSIFRDILYKELTSAGANPERIFQESFLTNSGSQQYGQINHATVVFSKARKTVQWTAGEDLTLLELAEAAGLSPGNACRMGVCQSCSVGLEEGTVHYDFRLTHQPGENQVLLCSAKPASGRVVLAL